MHWSLEGIPLSSEYKAETFYGSNYAEKAWLPTAS